MEHCKYWNLDVNAKLMIQVEHRSTIFIFNSKKKTMHNDDKKNHGTMGDNEQSIDFGRGHSMIVNHHNYY